MATDLDKFSWTIVFHDAGDCKDTLLKFVDTVDVCNRILADFRTLSWRRVIRVDRELTKV